MVESFRGKPFTQKAEEPHIKELRDVVGYDSFGKRLKRGDYAFVMNDRVFGIVRKLESPRSVDLVPTVQAWDSEKKALATHLFDYIETKSGGSYAADELCAIQDQRWKVLESWIENKKTRSNRTTAEEWYDERYPVIKLPWLGRGTIGENSSVGYISRVHKEANGYGFTLLFPGNNKIVIPHMRIGETMQLRINKGLSFISLTQGDDGKVYFDVTKVLLTEAASQPARPLELKRLNNDVELFERLKEDFDWMKQEDIEHVPPEFIRDLEVSSDFDWKRIQRLYWGVERDVVLKNVNISEKKYLGLRSYFRLLEFAHLAKGADNSKLSELTPEEKRECVEEFEKKVTAKREEILEKRRKREVELFGYDFSAALEYPRRFVSGETISPRPFLGQHYKGVITYLAGADEEYYLNHGEKIYDMFAEVALHEEGHFIGSAKRKENAQWKFEEMWTEWYSVVYPRHLRAEEPKGNTLYRSRVDLVSGIPQVSKTKHGSFELLKAFQDLTELAHQGRAFIHGNKITPEDIEISAIATFYQRRDRGTISLGKLKTIGFADLYDEVMYHAHKGKSVIPYSLAKRVETSRFDERFAGCSDRDYKQIKDKREKRMQKELRQAETNKPNSLDIAEMIIKHVYEHKVVPIHKKEV